MTKSEILERLAAIRSMLVNKGDSARGQQEIAFDLGLLVGELKSDVESESREDRPHAERADVTNPVRRERKPRLSDLAERIYRAIAESGDAGLTKNEIAQHLFRTRSGRTYNALDELFSAGLITGVREMTRGRGRPRLRLFVRHEEH